MNKEICVWVKIQVFERWYYDTFSSCDLWLPEVSFIANPLGNEWHPKINGLFSKLLSSLSWVNVANGVQYIPSKSCFSRQQQSVISIIIYCVMPYVAKCLTSIHQHLCHLWLKNRTWKTSEQINLPASVSRLASDSARCKNPSLSPRT